MGGWLIVDIAILVLVWLLNIALLVVHVAKLVAMRREERAARTDSDTDSDTKPDTSWLQSDLYVDGDDWELYDVWWRRTAGWIEVEYGVANWLPGQHEYRNDFIRVFQRGVGLEEESVRVSRVLLKGAEIRFVQTFLARDGSTPVIQADSSYMG
ncbi:hypothetical protein [Bifidobacterium castoris]|uniref:Uncharacterized protein n=1 Tax=Bifidobacterium castoris TaxID=2306972 RepID=A0A430FAD2_9BIFI|nr:hypothetical protein [Bifidobacterium castoris]RSX49794.1 hypothetical protein D2E22_0255 [Bifidobacterium castoris]